MADLAYLFHWAPADMHGMSLAELAHWQALAIERFKASRSREPARGR